jgi:hypothetical protein
MNGAAFIVGGDNNGKCRHCTAKLINPDE